MGDVGVVSCLSASLVGNPSNVVDGGRGSWRAFGRSAARRRRDPPHVRDPVPGFATQRRLVDGLKLCQALARRRREIDEPAALRTARNRVLPELLI